MRKRLQRIRDKLRKEMEVAEQRGIRPEDIRQDLPARVVELLAHPRLTDLPENPVGKTLEALRAVYADFVEQGLPEVVDLAEARKTIGNDAMYVDPIELHRIDDGRILRYDLTLPLLLTVRYDGQPLRIWAAGKAYRAGKVDAMHLEVFHQAEVLWLDERAQLDSWQMTGRVLQSVDRLFPGARSRSCRRSTRCAARPGRSRSKTTGDGSKCSPGASSATGLSAISAATRSVTSPSASAMASSASPCCATASTTSEGSKSPAWRDGSALGSRL